MSQEPESPNAPASDVLKLTGADFDAYLADRASSNAFTRPRLELKQRMLLWAPSIVMRLEELGIFVDVTGSDEHPNVHNNRRVDSQRVFFWRDSEARAELERLIDNKRSLASRLGDPAPHKMHVYLGLKLDAEGVEVSIELHPEAWVDLRNMRARLADPLRSLELTSALEVLPEQFAIGLGPFKSDPESMSPAAHRATSEEARGLLDRAEAEKLPLWLGWRVSRDVAIDHSELLDEQLGDAIVALGPIYKLIAWAPDNDLLVLDREWDAAKADRARAHEEAEQSRAEWEARREGERQKKPRERDDEQHVLSRWRAKEVRSPAREQSDSKESASKPAENKPAIARPPLAKSARPIVRSAPKVTDVDPNVAVEKGTRVQVLAGPFSGKTGVVQDVDGKGGARVLLGLLAMKLDVKDLVASVESPQRPVLSSSHRKPPARS